MVRYHRVRVLRRVVHPGRGFTQGLLAEDGCVWESVGNYGESVLRRYSLGDRHVAAEAAVPEDLFAEGICRVGGSIWQLTWQERVALRWDANSLELLEQVAFNRQGWGICAVTGAAGDAVREVVTSDGTSELVRRDPETLEPIEVVHVRCGGARVRWLNDLAWSQGRVWANVLGAVVIAGIDLATGEVTDIVDARAVAERHLRDEQAVMNGIAALPEPGEFLLTGKHWRRINHVRLIPDRNRGHRDRLLKQPQ